MLVTDLNHLLDRRQQRLGAAFDALSAAAQGSVGPDPACCYSWIPYG